MQLATDKVRLAAMDEARRLGLFIQERHDETYLRWSLWDHERKMYGAAILGPEAFSEKEPSEAKIAISALMVIGMAWDTINREVAKRKNPPNRDVLGIGEILKYKFTGEKVEVTELHPEHAGLKGADGRAITEAYEGLDWWP